MATKIDWFAVDWGTSNLRVWGISSTGEILIQKNSNKGAGLLQQHEFERTLLELISQHIPNKSVVDVVICGMAGSRQGWKEAQYIEMPAKTSQIVQNISIVDAEDQRLKVYILPGLCQRSSETPDVIRGEETQLFGLINQSQGYSGTVCIPGTHSKWVAIDNEIISSSQTNLTGELFDLLCKHSMLRHSIEFVKNDNNIGFQEGVERATSEKSSVISDIFSIRARQLLFDSSPTWSYSYLSGLLIGHEIKHGISIGNVNHVTIIGESTLVTNYLAAFQYFGIDTDLQSAEELTLSGLKATYDFLKN